MRRCASVFVAMICGFLIFERPAWADNSVEEARRRVVLLQFLRGLHLTSAQVESLQVLHAKANSLREAARQAATAEERQFAKALRQLEEILAREGEVPDSLKRIVRSLNEQDKLRRRRLSRDLRGLEDRAQGLLTENQLHVARTAKLCLIPPQPGAIGADRGNVAPALERRLRRLRECQEHRYTQLRERTVERFLEAMRKERPDLPADTLQVEAERVRTLLDSVRVMDEGHFLASLPEIAAELQGKPVPKASRYKARNVGKLLMDPLVPELLAELREGKSRTE